MIVFDTNIISEIQKINCDRNVQRWMDRQEYAQFRICSIVLAELKTGAEAFRLKTGSSKHLRSLESVLVQMGNPVCLDFDRRAAELFGTLKAGQAAIGKSKPIFDLMIAAICIANGATLLTRNAKDFEDLDVKVINPFEANV